MQQNATNCNSGKIQPPAGLDKQSVEKELAQKRLNAIPLVLQGLGDGEVAAQVGVDRVTVFRWRKDERFVQELERQRAMLMRSTMARVQGLLEPALNIIQKQLSSSDERIALRAAAMLLRIASPARLERRGGAVPGEKPPTFEEALAAYVEAPMPNDPRYPQYEAWRRKRYAGIGPCIGEPEDENEDEDEDEDE